MKKQDLDFMQQISDCFLSQQSNQFLLTGNVNDVCRCPWESSKSDSQYVLLSEYLTKRLSIKRRLVITYNIARGIQFVSDTEREIAKDIYLSLFPQKEKKFGITSFEEVTTKSSVFVFPSLVFLRKLCEASSKIKGSQGYSIAVVIEHVSSIIPNNPLAQMSDSDRQRLIFFKEWLTEPGFAKSDHLLILISDTSSAVQESIRSLPTVINVNIVLPDANERKQFISYCLHNKTSLKLKGTQQRFADLSAGMTLLGIEQTMRLAKYRKGSLDQEDFISYLNQLLVNQIGDHIELIRPDYAFDQVIGNTTLKKQLKRVKKALATNDRDASPVGILVTGPNGVGKTYTMMAWAGECDRIVLVLKNLRGAFFGQTDQIFEKIRNVLEVLGSVIIIVDEADTVFAKPGKDTHETEQRLFGNVIKMMGDPKNRSRIVWVLMTARPDNLAPDLKRSGRCGLHLPVFDPEGKDRTDFIDFVLSECDFSLKALSSGKRKVFLELTESYSPADFRELIAELKTEKLVSRKPLTADSLMKVINDYIPGNIGIQRRIQTLQALLHCSRRSLIPDTLDIPREKVMLEIDRLKSQLE